MRVLLNCLREGKGEGTEGFFGNELGGNTLNHVSLQGREPGEIKKNRVKLEFRAPGSPGRKGWRSNHGPKINNRKKKKKVQGGDS